MIKQKKNPKILFISQEIFPIYLNLKSQIKAGIYLRQRRNAVKRHVHLCRNSAW